MIGMALTCLTIYNVLTEIHVRQKRWGAGAGLQLDVLLTLDISSSVERDESTPSSCKRRPSKLHMAWNRLSNVGSAEHIVINSV